MNNMLRPMTGNDDVPRDSFMGVLESNAGLYCAKRFEDCHCEGKARSNLYLTKTEIAWSFTPRNDMIGQPEDGRE